MISRERLAAIPALSGVPAELRDRLAERFQELTVEAGQTIFSEGDPGEALFFVAEGRVAIQMSVDRAKGTVKTLSVMGPGDVFGEMALLEKTRRSASAVAMERTVLLSLAAEDLSRWLSTDVRVPLRLFLPFLESVNSRLRQTTREMVILFDVGGVLALNLDAADLAVRLTEVLTRMFDDPVSSAFYLWNEFSGEYEQVAGQGPWPEKNKTARPVSDSLFHWMAEKNECVLAENWPADGRFDDRARASWPSFHSLLAAPVMGEHLPVGYIVFGQEGGAGFFSSNHRRVLSGVVNVVAPAFDSASLRLEKRSQQRLARSRQNTVDF